MSTHACQRLHNAHTALRLPRGRERAKSRRTQNEVPDFKMFRKSHTDTCHGKRIYIAPKTDAARCTSRLSDSMSQRIRTLRLSLRSQPAHRCGPAQTKPGGQNANPERSQTLLLPQEPLSVVPPNTWLQRKMCLQLPICRENICAFAKNRSVTHFQTKELLNIVD